MDIANLIKHPELLDRETLYELRGLLALYPYYQSARLLLLQNLFLLHDHSFNDELRDAALYITDRSVIFALVEAGHYQLPEPSEEDQKKKEERKKHDGDRTISLIDDFLEQMPDEEEGEQKKKKRKPTPADATNDYISYLLETESEEDEEKQSNVPQMKGQELIDNFLNNDNGKIKLPEDTEYTPEPEDDDKESSEDNKDGYFTETLAKIYVKQGRYEKALEIIKRLNLNYPKKNAYFADQMRFLEKLILNDSKNTNK